MMSAPCFLGLDIGTLGVKGVVVAADPRGGAVRVLARARLDHGVDRPRQGWAEQDAEARWWDDGVAVIRALLAQPGVNPADISAVGVCGLTPCLCLLGEDGRPLRPAILYDDNRALEQLTRAQAILSTPPQPTDSQSTNSQSTKLTAQAVTPKWMWLAEHEPDIVARAKGLCSSHNYVVFRLTGRLTMDYDTASIMGGVFDSRSKSWDAPACAALGLDVRLLPQLHAATAVVGQVTPAAAEATGLPLGTPVIAGAGDTFPTIVGCGAVGPGDAMISFGTTGLLTLTTRPLESAAAGPHFEEESEGGAVAWAANVLACGRLLDWFREGFGGAVTAGAARPDFATLDRCAEAIPAGSEGLVALPHLMGRRTPDPDPRARGILFGLTPGHTASHVYRALLESFGYAVRQGYDPIRPRVRRIIATAGGASSPLWRQIVADILGAEIEYYPQGSGALGIAFLAAYATGAVKDFDAIRDAWLVQREITMPDAANARRYDNLYALYCHLDGSLSTAFHMLADAMGTDKG